MTGWCAFAALWALGAIMWYPVLKDFINVPQPILMALTWPPLALAGLAYWVVNETYHKALELRVWWWAGKNEKAPPKERPIDPE